LALAAPNGFLAIIFMPDILPMFLSMILLRNWGLPVGKAGAVIVGLGNSIAKLASRETHYFNLSCPINIVVRSKLQGKLLGARAFSYPFYA